MSHEITDKISLELGRRVASRLRQQPKLIQVARDNLSRWAQLNASSPTLLRCYAEWREILDRPLEDVYELLVSETDEGQRLRQNSPFVGVLNAREVWELKQEFRHATTTA